MRVLQKPDYIRFSYLQCGTVIEDCSSTSSTEDHFRETRVIRGQNRSIICHLKVELLFVIEIISFRMITCHTSLNKTVCYCTMKGSWRGIFAPKGLYMDRNRNKLEKVCPLTFETDCWQILVTKLTPSPPIEVDLIWERSWNVLAVERAQIYAFTGYILD